jgi:hypothetical protein
MVVSSDDELDKLLEIDNRFSVIEKVFIKGEGYKIVEEAFLKNIDKDKNNILYIYTDVSKKGNNCSIGWMIFNDKEQLIAKHYLKINNNFEVMELEILAILTAIFTIKSGSKINLFTDNLGVYQVWNKLFETDTLTWSTRRIWDIKFIVLWNCYINLLKIIT